LPQSRSDCATTTRNHQENEQDIEQFHILEDRGVIWFGRANGELSKL
jgi:hypothetical protein